MHQPNAKMRSDASEFFCSARAKALMEEDRFRDAPQALFGLF
jgi:hypothetical protein